MSGIALATLAIASVVKAGIDYEQGQKQQRAQKRAIANQELAQKRAETRAQAEALRAERAQRAGRVKKPDTRALLARERALTDKGVGGTLLTGATGAGKGTLGSSSLLGGVKAK